MAVATGGSEAAKLTDRRDADDTFRVLDLVHASVLILDLEGRIVVWNTASETLYGWSRDHAIGKDARSLLCADPVLYDAALKVFLATGHWEGETQRRTRDGRILTIDVKRTLRRDGSGEPLHIVESGRDLTAKKEEEARYRHIEHRYTNLFHALAASIWEVDFSPIDDLLRELLRDGITDFRAHFEANPKFVRRMMSVAQVIDVNDRTVALFGRGDRQEILGPSDRFWADGSEPVFAAGVLAGIAKKSGYASEVKLRAIDGRVFDALMTISYPPATLGKGTLVVGVIDLSEQRRADEALRVSEKRYRQLFGAMAVAYLEVSFDGVDALIAELGAQGVTTLAEYFEAHEDVGARAMRGARVVAANEKSVELFKASSVDALLVTSEHYWTPSSRAQFFRLMEGRAAKAPPPALEMKLRTFDGSGDIIDVSFTVWSPPSRPAGENGVIALIDIGERARAHVALKNSESRYRALFHGVPTALGQVDVSGITRVFEEARSRGVTDLVHHVETDPEVIDRVVEAVVTLEVNDAACELFGVERREELLGPIAWCWQGAPARATLRRSLSARLRGAPSFTEQTTLTAPDGRSVDVLYFTAFSSELAELGMDVVALVDIRERVRAERMLEQMQAEFAHSARVSMLGELTASIAHEVNQPLTAVISGSSATSRWLDREPPLLDEAKAALARVRSDARRAADIIARVRSMVTKDRTEQLDTPINVVVEDAVQFLRHESVARAIPIVLDLASSSPRARVDRVQIQQVIVNLAVNAMQAMSRTPPRAGVVTIRTLRLGDFVQVCVEDSGPGFSEDDAGRLFQSFFTTKAGGMGMGLRISRSIIEAHEGTIDAKNRPEGGAVFAFALPASR